MGRVEYPPEQVPCGKCAGCRRQRAIDWTTRMVHESQLHDTTSAVTLTYSDEALPAGGALKPSDFTTFLKRLRWERSYTIPALDIRGRKYRKRIYRPFRYFMCGEYGEKNHRPHYHAILFGVDFPDREPWMHTGKSKQYRSDSLSRIWPHGWALIGEANPAAIRYVAGYLNKKLNGQEPVSADTGLILEPYQRMSRRPAIAKRWLEQHWREVYDNDSVIIDGRELRPPAAYDRWLRDNHPLVYSRVRSERFTFRESRPKESAKRFRQRCEAIQLKQAPYEERPL